MLACICVVFDLIIRLLFVLPKTVDVQLMKDETEHRATNLNLNFCLIDDVLIFNNATTTPSARRTTDDKCHLIRRAREPPSG